MSTDHFYFTVLNHYDADGNHVVERQFHGDPPKDFPKHRFFAPVPAVAADGRPMGMAMVPIEADDPADALMRSAATKRQAIADSKKPKIQMASGAQQLAMTAGQKQRLA